MYSRARWARGAIVFQNAMAQLPGTLPSHMSMMTSLYPAEHGVYPSPARPLALSLEIRTLAEILRDASFRTAAFTEGGYVSAVHGFDRGFEEFDDRCHTWRRVLNQGIGFLRRVGAEEPFFLFLHTYRVHTPYVAPTELRPLFWPDEAPLSFPPTGENLERVNRGELVLGPRDAEHLRALYDAGVRAVDRRFPELLRALDETGLRRRTLLVLTADHGEEFLEHGRLAHVQIYQPTAHVPLIIEAPGRPGRRQLPEPVELVDLAPTLLAFAGVEHPAQLRGRDLLALAARERPEEGGSAYCESYVEPRRSLLARRAGRLIELVATVRLGAARGVSPPARALAGPAPGGAKVTPAGGAAALAEVSGLVVQGTRAAFRLRSVGAPVPVEVHAAEGERESWVVDGRWREHVMRFPGGEEERHVVLLAAGRGTAAAGERTGNGAGIGSGDGLGREGGSAAAPGLMILPPSEGLLVFPEVRLFDLGQDSGERRSIAREESELCSRLLAELAQRMDEQILVSPPRETVLAPEQRERLRALGYVE